MERFLSRVSEALKSYGAVVRVKGWSLEVDVYGDNTMIRDSWIRLREVLSDYGSSQSPRINLRRLSRDARIAVPVDVLVEVLKLMGYNAEEDDDGIKTDADYEEVLTFASMIRNALEELRLIPAARRAKHLIAALSASTGARVEDVISTGLNAGILRDDEGKLLVKKDWRQALRELAKVIRSE